jgi:hypothetical protein
MESLESINFTDICRCWHTATDVEFAESPVLIAGGFVGGSRLSQPRSWRHHAEQRSDASSPSVDADYPALASPCANGRRRPDGGALPVCLETTHRLVWPRFF